MKDRKLKFRLIALLVDVKVWLLGLLSALRYRWQLAVAALAVPTEKARAVFELCPEWFYVPELVKFQMLTVGVDEDAPAEAKAAAEAQAQEAHHRAQAGEDFGVLVQEYETDPRMRAGGGRLPWTFEGQDLEGERVNRLDGVLPGRAGGVIHGAAGFHVFQVQARRPAQRFPFEAAKPGIKWWLRYSRAKDPAGAAPSQLN